MWRREVMSGGYLLGLVLVALGYFTTSETAPTAGWVKIIGILPDLTDGRLMVECRATSGMDLEWWQGEQLRGVSDTITINDPETGEAVCFLLLDTDTDYSGTYTCRGRSTSELEDVITLDRYDHINKNKVSITPDDTTLKEGESFTLLCQGPNELEWRLNGDLLVTNNANVLIINWREVAAHQYKSRLRVDQGELAHAGNYTCMDITDENNQYSVQVQIVDDAQGIHSTADRVRIIRPIGDINVTEGDAVTIVCQGDSDASLFWTFNDEILQPSDGVSMMTTITMSGEQIMGVNIASALTSWSGVYACMDHTNVTNMDSVRVHVSGNHSDTSVHITSAHPLVVMAGDSFRVLCEAGPSAVLYWTHNKLQLNSSGNIQITTNAMPSGNQMTSVTVTSTSVASAGVYTCQDKLDESNQDGVLVTVNPQKVQSIHSTTDRVRIIHPLGDINVTEGDAVTIVCQGDSNTSLFWTFNNEILQPSDDVSMMTTITMSGEQIMGVNIASALTSWSGVYACMDHTNVTNIDSVWVHVSRNHSGTRMRILSPRVSRLHVQFGEPFTLICAGPSTTRPTWYHNAQPIGYRPNTLVAHTMDIITGELVTVLTRLSPDGAISGVYACRDGLERSVGGEESGVVEDTREVVVGGSHSVHIDV